MVEVYNEEYKDLLGKGPPAGKKHQVTHDDKGRTSISFVETYDVCQPSKVMRLHGLHAYCFAVAVAEDLMLLSC